MLIGHDKDSTAPESASAQNSVEAVHEFSVDASPLTHTSKGSEQVAIDEFSVDASLLTHTSKRSEQVVHDNICALISFMLSFVQLCSELISYFPFFSYDL